MTRRPGPGLSARLFVAITLVILAGAGTLLLVSLLIAPVVFHDRLARAGVVLDDQVTARVDDGFALAVVAGVVAGVTAATAVAVTVAVVVARRITRPVSHAARIAQRLADGDHSARMTPPRMGPELAALADAVNVLGGRLEEVERHRQQLIGDVAHELRTPLAALEATVTALTDGVLPLDEDSLATLLRQTGRLSRLTHDLAAVSRSQEHAFTVDRRPVDLAALVRECVSSHAARYAAAGVALVALADAAVPAVADGDRVTEILDQLLDNALRHCAPGDAVTVALESDPPGPPAGAGPAGASTGVRVVVADTGCGFPSSEAERIFRRFHRAPREGAAPARDDVRGGGSGVGLTIARALAEAQGGALRAHSPGPGAGARFVLTLPR